MIAGSAAAAGLGPELAGAALRRARGVVRAASASLALDRSVAGHGADVYDHGGTLERVLFERTVALSQLDAGAQWARARRLAAALGEPRPAAVRRVAAASAAHGSDCDAMPEAFLLRRRAERGLMPPRPRRRDRPWPRTTWAARRPSRGRVG